MKHCNLSSRSPAVDVWRLVDAIYGIRMCYVNVLEDVDVGNQIICFHVLVYIWGELHRYVVAHESTTLQYYLICLLFYMCKRIHM